MERTYRWAECCERRIDVTLFSGGKCPSCIASYELNKLKSRKEIIFSEEELERMGDLRREETRSGT